jgi:HEAT repeat protein
MADDKQFLSDIQSTDPDVRFAAWRIAGEVSPSIIPELGKLAASDNPGIAKAAREALTTMTHSHPNRAAVAAGLLPLRTADSFRLLSLIAGEDAVPAIAKSIEDPKLREEVVYCLERIPGPASDKALMAAYKEAAVEFKPRILAALGHRRTAAAADLAAEAARSSNKDIALAGAKASGRIGKKLPPFDTDSVLRYADAQGSTPEALRVYKSFLTAPEPHVQCAAIIGLAKLKTPEAATAIMPHLKSENRTIRITAAKAWKSMSG